MGFCSHTTRTESPGAGARTLNAAAAPGFTCRVYGHVTPPSQEQCRAKVYSRGPWGCGSGCVCGGRGVGGGGRGGGG